jgi:HSP20 family protein
MNHKKEELIMHHLVKPKHHRMLRSLFGEEPDIIDRWLEEWEEGTKPWAWRIPFPATDIKEEEDNYIIKVDVPGIDRKDIDIQMEEGVLTIKGETEKEEKEEAKGYLRRERVKGAFARRFSLPDVDPEGINAKFKDGVLTITAPKAKKRLGRKIEIE